MVVGCRRDTKKLFAIEVKGNRVTERVLRPGLSEFGWHEPLAYEQEIDRWEASRRRRRVPPAVETADVVDLGTRRGVG